MADIESESLPVSLRPWPTQDSSSDDLQLQFARLFQQRGHFRHITEEGLKEEIATAKDGPDDVMEGVEEDEEAPAQDEKERYEEIMKAKIQMVGFIGTALNEARYMQDYLSLLVSRDAPKLADTTLSPYVKEFKLPGTLGVDKWPLKEPDVVEKRREELAAKGWRMKGLEDAADSVLKAATRLESEVRKETQYWEEVLSIAKKGWSVRRIARDGRRPILGVQFGFAEASDHFKNRGFSPLRMDDKGSIILDAGLTQKPKAVRVRIQEDGRITGTSKLPSTDDITQPSIEDLIRRARDSLFEEELYHEMSLETRILLSHDVKMRDSVIHLPAPATDGSKRIVLIDIVLLDEILPQIDDHSSDSIAQNVAEALRLLLCYEHRQRLHRRSQIPRPLSEQKIPNLPPPILRPLLNFFHNAQAIQSVRDYLQHTKSILSSAGLNVSTKLTFDPKLSNLSATIKTSPTEIESSTDKLVNTLIRPQTTTASIRLPSSLRGATHQESLSIAIRTLVTQPIFGTEYTLTLPQAVATAIYSEVVTARTFTFTILADLTSYIDQLISLHLSNSVIAKSFSGWTPLKELPKLTKQPRKLNPSDASKQPKKRLRVNLEQTRLLVTCVWEGPIERVEEYAWDGSAGAGKRPLEDVVADAIPSLPPSKRS
ncbi:uncharacterized protein BDZ99DRAFT_495421 [Mytilinidion resinicola]|uniref:Mediator of RNA polymerase II transcription subunit 17 n=1 Tax=Mytilinidion resinicola TaxID=574789 RepID=A0A6A6YZ29_9PEZI|nr:uncharacterized protein BDZ99DRAFT_495421 [Mytilinidion resinicola]KAF2813798.1 hypothetical protein BDZ99DRAFT_495421 [Mytilinidion resinicola]